MILWVKSSNQAKTFYITRSTSKRVCAQNLTRCIVLLPHWDYWKA